MSGYKVAYYWTHSDEQDHQTFRFVLFSFSGTIIYLYMPNLACSNLAVIETIDSIKLAEALNASINRNDKIKGTIDVFVQVNTSNEDG